MTEVKRKKNHIQGKVAKSKMSFYVNDKLQLLEINEELDLGGGAQYLGKAKGPIVD